MDLQEQWTSVSVPFRQGGVCLEASALHAGSLDGFGENGTPTGPFRPMEILAGAGVGFALPHGLRAGGAVQGLYLGGTSTSLKGLSFSAGLEWEVGSATLGVVARNLGPSLRGEFGAYPLPTEFGLSIRSDPERRASFRAAALRSRDGAPRGAVVSSVRLHPVISLMAGMNYLQEANSQPMRPAAGLEAHLRGVEVGYAFSPTDELGATHILSVTIVRPPRARPDEARVAIREPASTSRAEPRQVPAPAPAPVPGPSPERFQVWGGIHRSAESAAAEVRALRYQKVVGAQVVAQDNGMFRVRVAGGLTVDAADALARRVQGSVEPE